MVDPKWCDNSGFLDKRGNCRNPDGCTCKTIAQLERELADEVTKSTCYYSMWESAVSRADIAERELAEAGAELDTVKLERDANHNLAVANGERAKEEDQRATAAEAERDRLAAEVERLSASADIRDLKDHWHSFCDADPFEGGDTFAERMEARGLIELVAVTQEALEDGFAAERGIVPGGSMWQLTEAGRASLQAGEKGE